VTPRREPVAGPAPDPTEALAVAWEMHGHLGLPFVVRENGDISLEPEALDAWWVKNRGAVMRAYRERHTAPTNREPASTTADGAIPATPCASHRQGCR
jgi:hypothetical protein